MQLFSRHLAGHYDIRQEISSFMRHEHNFGIYAVLFLDAEAASTLTMDFLFFVITHPLLIPSDIIKLPRILLTLYRAHRTGKLSEHWERTETCADAVEAGDRWWCGGMHRGCDGAVGLEKEKEKARQGYIEGNGWNQLDPTPSFPLC